MLAYASGYDEVRCTHVLAHASGYDAVMDDPIGYFLT
jgi:hypothetical protein